jgi:UDP-arabinose 4-epimerase
VNNKVVVTGGAGYIGSHTCKALANAGYLPIVFDSLERGCVEAVRWGPLVKVDLRDKADLAAKLADAKPAAVIHFAALAYVGESVLEPSRYYENNVVGTLNLLNAMRMANVSNIVFSSTCAVYGVPRKTPIDETFDLAPINPYGTTKRVAEEMLRDFGRAYGIKSVCLRYFNAAGDDLDGEIGENHDPETHLIPLALMAAAGELPSLKIFGNDYPTRDGTCVRDYVHVSDLASAHVAALRYLERETESQAINIGTGHGFSVAEVIESVRRVTGKQISVEYVDRREGDPPELVAVADKAHRVLGWRPLFTDLDSIVASAWRWHQSEQARAIRSSRKRG